MSLSILLTADRIATDFIFQDGEYIDLADAEQVLVDKEVVFPTMNDVTSTY